METLPAAIQQRRFARMERQLQQREMQSSQFLDDFAARLRADAARQSAWQRAMLARTIEWLTAHEFTRQVTAGMSPADSAAAWDAFEEMNAAAWEEFMQRWHNNRGFR